ncbi:MAG: hypothetical protein K8R59_17415 [Thermoanaerobaculales bacterium]|nr:hypothetical protein [Thermoanaerobaculales bacterium]
MATFKPKKYESLKSAGLLLPGHPLVQFQNSIFVADTPEKVKKVEGSKRFKTGLIIKARRRLTENQTAAMVLASTFDRLTKSDLRIRVDALMEAAIIPPPAEDATKQDLIAWLVLDSNGEDITKLED